MNRPSNLRNDINIYNCRYGGSFHSLRPARTLANAIASARSDEANTTGTSLACAYVIGPRGHRTYVAIVGPTIGSRKKFFLALPSILLKKNDEVRSSDRPLPSSFVKISHFLGPSLLPTPSPPLSPPSLSLFLFRSVPK